MKTREGDQQSWQVMTSKIRGWPANPPMTSEKNAGDVGKLYTTQRRNKQKTKFILGREKVHALLFFDFGVGPGGHDCPVDQLAAQSHLAVEGDVLAHDAEENPLQGGTRNRQQHVAGRQPAEGRGAPSRGRRGEISWGWRTDRHDDYLVIPGLRGARETGFLDENTHGLKFKNRVKNRVMGILS